MRLQSEVCTLFPRNTMTLKTIFVLSISFLLLAGSACSPDALSSPSDNGDGGGTSTPDASGTADTTGGSDTGTSTDTGSAGGTGPEFPAVATVLATSCATGMSCHGEGSGFGMVIMGDTAATPENVRAAIEDKDANGSSRKLIAPGQPEESEIYLRVSAMMGVNPMPPGNPLPADQVETIRAWIAAGANYE